MNRHRLLSLLPLTIALSGICLAQKPPVPRAPHIDRDVNPNKNCNFDTISNSDIYSDSYTNTDFDSDRDPE